MKVLGGLYIELIGLTHFATAAATVFYIYTEVKWSFIRPIDSHTLKTAPLKVHVFIFIHDVCCCFHAEQGWNIPLLSLFLTLFFVFLSLRCWSFHPGNGVFLSNCNDANGHVFQNYGWTLAHTWKPCWTVQCSVFPCPGPSCTTNQWRASWMQGNTYVDLVKSQPPPVRGEEL